MKREWLKRCIETEVYASYREAKGRLNCFDKLWCKWLAPQSNAVYMIRLMQYKYALGGINRLFAKLVQRRLITKYGITIGVEAQIGIGLQIPHPSSITIGEAAIIGENFRIFQNSTIGAKNKQYLLYPRIGNSVTVYACASIIGDINVCDNVVVGANSVLMHDAQEPGVYVGVPAKKVR